MTDEEREEILGLCNVVLTDVKWLIQNVEELSGDASEDDVNIALASGIYDIEKHIRHIRESRNDPLLL